MKTQEIRSFLADLADLDFRYLRIQMSLANDARTLIKDFNLGREEFCILLDIHDHEYDIYINGGFNYDIMKMARMNAAFCKLSARKAEQELKGKFTDIIVEDHEKNK